jgi:hypothetical protein
VSHLCFIPLAVLLTESSLGKIREMRGLRAGSEAQEMATFISADDQMAAPTPSRVVSGEMEISYKFLRRTMLVMHMLRAMSVFETLTGMVQSYSQPTKCNDEHYANLLITRQLQSPGKRHGEGENHNICSDIQGRVGEPECQLVHAMAVNALISEVCDGNAHKERATEHLDGVDRENANHDVVDIKVSGKIDVLFPCILMISSTASVSRLWRLGNILPQ